MISRAYSVFICVLIVMFISFPLCATAMVVHSNLLNITAGKYRVGFKKIVWINHKICPDPTRIKANIKSCRKVEVTFYYPGKIMASHFSKCPLYLINTIKKRLMRVKNIQLKKYIMAHMKILNNLKVPAMLNAKVRNGTYPIILFSPGAIDNSAEYINHLINWASHGYIVAAVNSPFLTKITLPNGKVIPSNKKMNSINNLVLLYKMKFFDMLFVYDKIRKLKLSRKVKFFSHFDIRKVGVIGHSGGASAAIAMARKKSSDIHAAIAMDAPNQTDPNTNINLIHAAIVFPGYFDIFSRFKVPMLQLHSSNAVTFLSAPQKEFQLGKNNFLVTITKNKNKDFFKHMDYTDYPLFKEIPFIQHVDAQFAHKNIPNPIFPGWACGTIKGRHAVKIVDTYIVGFFNAYLKNNVTNIKLFKLCRPLIADTVVDCHNSAGGKASLKNY